MREGPASGGAPDLFGQLAAFARKQEGRLRERDRRRLELGRKVQQLELVLAGVVEELAGEIAAAGSAQYANVRLADSASKLGHVLNLGPIPFTKAIDHRWYLLYTLSIPGRSASTLSLVFDLIGGQRLRVVALDERAARALIAGTQSQAELDADDDPQQVDVLELPALGDNWPVLSLELGGPPEVFAGLHASLLRAVRHHIAKLHARALTDDARREAS